MEEKKLTKEGYEMKEKRRRKGDKNGRGKWKNKVNKRSLDRKRNIKLNYIEK